MKDAQMAMVLLGIAVIIVLLVLINDDENFTGLTAENVSAATGPAGRKIYRVTEEEKGNDRKAINIQEIPESQRVGENVGGNLGIEKDVVTNYQFNKNVIPEWQCYSFTDLDKYQIDREIKDMEKSNPLMSADERTKISQEAEKKVCERVPGRVYTGDGTSANFPGCNGCVCCEKNPAGETCAPSNGIWNVKDEFERSTLNSPCCQPPNYQLPKGYKTCSDPLLNKDDPVEKCVMDCCTALSRDKTKYDQSWYPMSRCACSIWCYHSSVPHFAQYGTATGYIYRRPSVQSTFYYGQ